MTRLSSSNNMSDLPTTTTLTTPSPTCQDESGPLEYIIKLMVEHNEYLFNRLVASSIRSLSLVSRTIFKLMSPRISYTLCILTKAYFSTNALFRLGLISFMPHIYLFITH